MSPVADSNRRSLLRSLLGAGAFFGWSSAQAKAAPRIARRECVVYQVDDIARAITALRMMGHHLDARPQTRITVVTLASGIDFLLEGAQDANGNLYDALVQALIPRGVDFRVCANTLASRQISANKVIIGASTVASGAAEITRLQIQEAYAYLKP